MDVTTLFKAYIKTVRTINKDLDTKGSVVKPTNILKPSNRDPLLKTPKEIIKQLHNLQKFFEANKAAYLNVVNYLSTKKTMTESDRIKVDTEAENVISLCSQMISTYRKELRTQKHKEQLREHYENVINCVERYLREVSKNYAETKAIRVKKVIEMHKISKLETTSGKSKEEKATIVSPFSLNKEKEVVQELSPEEMQMFESENDLLFNELNNMSQEVREMESKVVHIAELQDQLTTNVLEQEKSIDRISNIVTSSTEDMKDANEQIRQAIQRNAGLRVWVLFFLLVMSFSLIFLDWYND